MKHNSLTLVGFADLLVRKTTLFGWLRCFAYLALLSVCQFLHQGLSVGRLSRGLALIGGGSGHLVEDGEAHHIHLAQRGLLSSRLRPRLPSLLHKSLHQRSSVHNGVPIWLKEGRLRRQVLQAHTRHDRRARNKRILGIAHLLSLVVELSKLIGHNALPVFVLLTEPRV